MYVNCVLEVLRWVFGCCFIVLKESSLIKDSCFLYLWTEALVVLIIDWIPPRKSAASYRADEWDVNKGEECIIRLEDKLTGELYALAFLRKGELLPVEPVIDSSRWSP
ncbi:hypothetical protein OIU76_023552 [Salix suchowensis]|nr:hypothetical protein OIU76_023552 [Salix suchowensis]